MILVARLAALVQEGHVQDRRVTVCGGCHEGNDKGRQATYTSGGGLPAAVSQGTSRRSEKRDDIPRHS